jgi:hypothetical protein
MAKFIYLAHMALFKSISQVSKACSRRVDRNGGTKKIRPASQAVISGLLILTIICDFSSNNQSFF